MMDKENKQSPHSTGNDWFGKFGYMLPVFGSLAGLFAAMFWIAGRSYASGYFSAMNIPLFQVTFSLWEYAEVSWNTLFLSGVVLVLITAVGFWIASRLPRSLMRLLPAEPKISDKKEKPSRQLTDSARRRLKRGLELASSCRKIQN